MSIEKMVEEIKQRPGFAQDATMILAHNSLVEPCGKNTHAIMVNADELKLADICQELGSRKGIFAITAQANQGMRQVGDDLLLLVIAGDQRQNVLPVYMELMDRINSEVLQLKPVGAQA